MAHDGADGWGARRDGRGCRSAWRRAGRTVDHPVGEHGFGQVAHLERAGIEDVAGGEVAGGDGDRAGLPPPVAGVVRGRENEPVRLGAPELLGALSGSSSGLAWLDDVTLGVLTETTAGPQFTEQLVGGPATTSDAPVGAASIAGATSISTARLRVEDGSLFVKRGANWQRTAGGVLVLATQQGSPQ